MPATFEQFASELDRLCARFEQGRAGFMASDYSEARVRADFLDPFFRALGWDLENRQGLIQAHREVEIESRADEAGGHRRADYLFRTDRTDRFIFEAKKPAMDLARYGFQAKRYAWNKNLPIAVLGDFEGLRIFIVGARPRVDEQEAGLWRSWHFQEYTGAAREIWELLSRDAIAAGSIDKLIEGLPRKAAGKGRARQQWLIKPDRTRALDTDFLNFLDEARRTLAQDLLKENDRADLLQDNRLNEAVQRILDRLLFLRICEDRDIDTGRPLAMILRNWRERSRDAAPRRVREAGLWAGDDAGGFVATDPRPPRWALWDDVVAHFKLLDRRPPSHMPFFNGNLFKEHFSETLKVGDAWLAGFLDDVSDEESPYLFNYIPVEILGTIYERFLGKVVRPHGRGVVIEEKPEVRKAGGVYYTPRYIVDYIVEQTIGKLLENRPPEKSLDLKILDPACGSGSFLIRAFERMCEHWQQELKEHPSKQKPHLCWADNATGDIHLTSDLKRRILTANIFGVDLDPGAVEVTQLSLYLKMLEGETRHTLAAERELFGSDMPLLPPLQENIQCGNSLIASDFSLNPDDLIRVRAFDWDVGFKSIMKSGGFDAVIGNPPYILLQDAVRDEAQLDYFRSSYLGASFKLDTYHLFIELGIKLSNRSGRVSLITPSNFLTNNHLDALRREILEKTQPEEIVIVEGGVFEGVSVDNAVFVLQVGCKASRSFALTRATADEKGLKPAGQDTVHPARVLDEKRAVFTSGVINRASALWDRLSAIFPQLGTLANVNFGKQLRDRSRFPCDVISVEDHMAIPRTHVACVTGKDIGRYSLQWSGLACLNDTIAQSGGCWDTSKHESTGKLLTRQIGKHPSFALDTTGYHCLNTLFMVTIHDAAKINPELLLGILNSSVIRTLWEGRFYDRRATFPKIKGTYLKELPIAVPGISDGAQTCRHDALVELVDKMLMLAPKVRAETNEGKKRTLQNAVEATDREIDRLVYELYGLTEEEIALVEGDGGK